MYDDVSAKSPASKNQKTLHESSLFAAAVSKQPYSGGGGTNEDDKEHSPSYAATHSCYASFTQMTNMVLLNSTSQ